MIASAAATAALTGPRTPLAPRMMADPSRTFGRCEPWASERATARQIVGVVGRFTDSASWRDRSSFATVDDASADTPLQAETENRYAVAKKLGERAFRNAKRRSPSGTRTQVVRVKAEYPNQLD